MDERVIYYIGGPADLTKQAWRGAMGDTIRFAVVEPANVTPGDSPKLHFQCALYRVMRAVAHNTYVAVYERMEAG